MNTPAYYTKPNTLTSPRKFFEEMPLMSEPELRVTGCIMLKTFGYDKQSDVLSISQLVKGTGMSQPSVIKGVRMAEERGSVFQMLIGPNGSQVRLVMLDTEKNRELQDLYLNGGISDYDFLLMCGVPLNLIKGSKNLSREPNLPVKKTPEPPKPNLPVKQIKTQDPDLTLLGLNSTSLSKEEDQVSGDAARVKIPEAVQGVKSEREGNKKSEDPGSLPRSASDKHGAWLNADLLSKVAPDPRSQKAKSPPPVPDAPSQEADGMTEEQRLERRRMARLEELRRQAEMIREREKQQAPAADPEAPAADPAPDPKPKAAAPRRSGLTEEQLAALKNPAAFVEQRLKTAAEKNQERLKEIHITPVRRLEHPDQKRGDRVEVEQFLTMPADAFVDKLYAECVSNPRPQCDWKNLTNFKRAVSDASADIRKKVIEAFRQGKGRAQSLAPILDNLKELGVGFTGTKMVSHA